MIYDPRKHHRPFGSARGRRSIRLKGHDYSSPSAYFITICAQNRECVFGEIVNAEMRLNEIGQIARETWDELSDRYPGVELDAFVVMPNHVHGIIVITDAARVGAIHELPLRNELPQRRNIADPALRRQMLLPKIIGYYKMNVAKRANRIRNMAGAPIWQRNYYEHIIRTEHDLDTIRRYIHNNPLNWKLDRDNLDSQGKSPPATIADYLADIASQE